VTDPKQRHVAVIAVHGVGYTEPCATAKHLADLLLGLGRLKLDQSVGWPGKDKARYSEFTKQPVIVPLRPPYLDPGGRIRAKARVADPENWLQKLLHVFDERLGYLARAFRGDIPPQQVEAQLAADSGLIAHEFMRSQLADYVGEEVGRGFDTTCMESERAAGSGAATTVHVYEAYWADLARPKSSFLSFFMAFYQLLFHLSSLSRTAVYYAALEHIGKQRWRAVSFLQAFASRMLVLPIPLLNLIMLLAGMTVITLSVPGDPLPWTVVIGCVIGLALVFASRILRTLARNPAEWIALLIVMASLGGGVAYGFARPAQELRSTVCNASPDDKDPALAHSRNLLCQQRARFVLAIEWWLLGGALLAELFLKYNTVRHRAFATGMVLLGVSLVVFCYFLHRTTDISHDIEQASFWTVQVDLAAIVLSWALFLGSVGLLWTSHLFCLYGKKARNLSEGQRARARAALRTGRLTLAASASIFLLTTVFIWSGLFQYATSKWSWYHSFKPAPPPIGQTLARPFTYLLPTPVRVQDWMARVGYSAKEPNEFGDYVRGLFLIGVTSGLPIMLALSIPAVIILIFTVVPSLLVSREQYHLQPNRWIEGMGNWYSHGLDATKVVTTLAWHAVFSVTLFFGALDFLYCNCLNEYFPSSLAWIWTILAPMTNLTMGMLSAAAGTLAVSGAALTAVILKYGKTPLDIVLDVDHYLRTSPLNNTPRARIVERYVSLLRLIANRDAEDGTPYYQSIVIGAHSLGALISADLLHFLNREGDPELGRLGFAVPKAGEERKVEIPISLLTFGNPLRQLLTRFFPHLYWWVNGTPDNSLAPLPLAAAELDDVRAATTPPLQLLGLTRWTSAYRSGDFVGRSVWLHNWYRRNGDGDDKGQPPQPPTVFNPSDGARELCIGIGGHNDYWNRSAPDIAEQLDLLIG